MVVILSTLAGVTYYEYNGLLCAVTIPDADTLSKFQQNVYAEKNHTQNNVCSTQEINNLRNINPLIFNKYEQK